MNLIDLNHPNVTKAYIIHEGLLAGSWEMIIVIETSLPTNPQVSGFNIHKLDEIKKAAKNYCDTNNRQVGKFRIGPST